MPNTTPLRAPFAHIAGLLVFVAICLSLLLAVGGRNAEEITPADLEAAIQETVNTTLLKLEADLKSNLESSLGENTFPADSSHPTDPSTAPLAVTPTASMTETRVEEIVRSYLLANPNLIVEVLSELEKLEATRKSEETKAAIASNTSQLWKDNSSFVAGNPNGDINIVEFFDYNCGYCRSSFKSVMQLIDDDPNIRVVFKEWPIRGEDSIFAARASIAAMKQNRFMELHSVLMSVDERVTESLVLSAAKSVGLDISQLTEDMTKLEVEAVISQNDALAQTLQLSGTPAFVIGDQLIPGAAPLEEFKRIVNEARANCSIC
jgi:protein-disulfide isomerase